MGQDDRPRTPRVSGAFLSACCLLSLVCLAASAVFAGLADPPPLADQLGPGLTPGPISLTYVRFETTDQALRVALPAPESWRELRLTSPARLVLDLDGVESRLPLAPAFYESRLDLGLLRAVRTAALPGQPGDHRTRLTLELTTTTACVVRHVGTELWVEISGEFPVGVRRELRGDGWHDTAPSAAASVTMPAPAAEVEADQKTRDEAATRLAAADRAFRAGQWTSASAAYAEALGISPVGEDSAWALFQLGNCRWLNGETAEARELFTRLAQEWPQSVWTLLARTCLEQR